MSIIILIISVSLACQIFTVIMAFRLVRVTGNRISWVLISFAFMLQAVRRAIPLYNTIVENTSAEIDPINEIIGLVLSIFMAVGVMTIAPFFTEIKQAEEAQQKSEERYRITLDRMFEGCQVISFDWRYLYLNDTAVLHGRRSKEELLGRTMMDAYPGIENTEMFAILRECMEHRVHRRLENKFTYPDGSEGWFELSIEPIPEGVFILSLDITERKNIDKVNREKEERYRTLFENMLEGLAYCQMIFDDHNHPVDWVYLDVNRAFVRITGLENVVGKNVTEAIPGIKETNPELFEIYGRVASTGRPEIFESDLKPLKMWLKVSVYSPKKNHFVAVFDNITEQKQADSKLRESETRFRATFEQAAVGITHTSKEGQFLMVNQRFCDIVGYSREEIIKLMFQSITYPADIEIDLDYHHQLLIGTIPTYSMEKRYIRKDGSLIWVNLTVSLAREESGAQEYFITVVEDISKRKRTEEELERILDALKRSNAELEQFAYVASHDLQEPLRMVSSYVQLLARRYKGKLDADADDFINYAVDGSDRMKTLINDLLSFSRVTTRGQSFASTKATEVFNQALNNLAVAIEEARAVVTSDPLPEVIVDPTQLGQVFQNLIGNAIKFRGERPPEIHVGAKQEKDMWVFSIKDNGIGIDPQYYDRLFRIFQRLNPKEQYPGTGIGLAVCKRIMERHGGRVWVESELGKGATFYFSIPIKKAEDIKND